MMIMVSISIALLILISGVHVYWACGGLWAVSAVIPVGKDGRPSLKAGEFGTWVVAVLVLGAAALLAIEAGIFTVAALNTYVRIGCWICAIVFALRSIGDFNYMGIFKRVKGTRFARMDTILYTPLCLWLCLTYFIVLLK